MASETVFPLEARELTVTLGGHAALDRVQFTLDGDKRAVVLGPNGAGKSVLLRALHGLIAPTQGAVLWAGSTRRPADQAMVFQRAVMLRRSALANVEYALAVRGVVGAERSTRAREAIERVGLAHVAHRAARVLSGGEQQRLALARAWSLRPRVIFLDEPTASLDPAAASEVERIIAEIHAAGTSIVMTTHHLGLARRVADEILFLDGGRLTEQTEVGVFFAAPRSREAAGFLEAELPWTASAKS